MTAISSVDLRRLACVADMAAAAEEMLPQGAFDYYAGGSGREWTLSENERAFLRWVFRRRVLVDVDDIDTSVTVLGRRHQLPVLLAPVALQRMAHPEGELATARAARGAGTTMVLSTLASSTIEEVAATGVNRWFQLYIHRDRGLTKELVARAVAAGYSAIVLTVDAQQFGRRDRDERNRFAPPPGCELAILAGRALGVCRASGMPEGPDSDDDDRAPASASPLLAYIAEQLDPGLTWDDVAWLRSLSELPVVIKGVITGQDAVRAAEAGAAAVSVSNHGGRQLDGDPAALDALPEVVDAVGDRVEVFMDGGVRRGTDVLCALALGARAVLVGRPQLWGLACGGQAGVAKVLDILGGDLALAMRLAGVRTVADIDRSLVARPSYFPCDL
jgi:4-hydroxymandelate oxidase